MRIVKINEIAHIWAKYARYPTGKRIKLIWDEIWQRNPTMAMVTVFTPFAVLHGTLEILLRKKARTEYKKYSLHYRIYRPDDPRLSRTHTVSNLD